VAFKVADVGFGLETDVSDGIVLLCRRVNHAALVVGEACEVGTVFQGGHFLFVGAGACVVDVHEVVLACGDASGTVVVIVGGGNGRVLSDVLREHFGWLER